MTSRWAVLALLCITRMSMGLHLQVAAAMYLAIIPLVLAFRWLQHRPAESRPALAPSRPDHP